MQLVQDWRGTGHQNFSSALFGGKRFDRKLSKIASNMQFTGNRSRRKSKITKLEGTENAGKYVHGLQMYKVPPTDNITLEEFEEFAIDRLKGELTNRSQQE